MVDRVKYNYYLLLKNLLRYLPAKILVVLFSFVVIPLLTYVLDVKEVSIYLVSIQLLNLFCTFSFDWIAKGILRFYTKYKLENKSIEFLSTIATISLVVYLIILIIYFLIKSAIFDKLSINNLIFALVIFLVIPCGIRQMLYQFVRIKNKNLLYTLSIIVYEIVFISSFLFISLQLQNAFAIILAMILAMIIVDLYLIKALGIKFVKLVKHDGNIVVNVLKYAIPLIITNISYWVLINSPLLIFQKLHNYLYAASISIAMNISNCTITTIASLFLFVAFPVFVKEFELNKNIKKHFTSFVQLYLLLLLPLVSLCCLYSRDIVNIFLPSEYYMVGSILPFFAILHFSHEHLKMINIKYHLKNKTYFEMIISSSIILLVLFKLPNIVDKYSIIGALITVLVTEIFLFISNLSFKLKNIDYINYYKILKTFVLTFGIVLVSHAGVSFLEMPIDKIFIIIKILLFFIFTYFLCYIFKSKILY